MFPRVELRRSRGALAGGLCAVVLLAAACSPESVPRAADDPPPPSVDPDRPYPFDRPAPPRDPTPVDGAFERHVTAEQIGGEPVFCQRCAPYRLDAGDYLLRLEAGDYHVHFEPVPTERACPTCRMPPGFAASGHYEVDGDTLRIFNDPNCLGREGTYRWRLQDETLMLTPLSDPCAFGDLRERFLTAYPWRESG